MKCGYREYPHTPVPTPGQSTNDGRRCNHPDLQKFQLKRRISQLILLINLHDKQRRNYLLFQIWKICVLGRTAIPHTNHDNKRKKKKKKEKNGKNQKKEYMDK